MALLRIGVLGTARISLAALIEPARRVSDTVVAGVAARDLACADAFALSHGIPAAYGRYEDMLADPGIDAVYIALPNSMHAPWTLRAIEAGKHVLCEKPFASCAAEARKVAAAADASGLAVMEAMHYRYHPLVQRAREIILEGALGPLRHIQCWTSFVIPDQADIRYDYALGGGAMMDGGCYAADFIRLAAGAEPAVAGALADTHPVGRRLVDRAMAVRFAFPGGGGPGGGPGGPGLEGWLESAFTRGGEFRAEAHVAGEEGHLWLTNFILAHDSRLLVTRSGSAVADEQATGDTSYVWQLRAFAAAALRGQPFPTTAGNAVATMSLVDAAYTAAGLPVRGRDDAGGADDGEGAAQGAGAAGGAPGTPG